MVKKLFLVLFTGYLIICCASCNEYEATKEQIEETELAIKKEKLLDEMHEDEVKNLVEKLMKKSQEMEFYEFVYPANNDKGYVFTPNTYKIRKTKEYTDLQELHDKYHDAKIDKFLDSESEDEIDILMCEELKKWNIENGKVRRNDYNLIENTLCPFCRFYLDDISFEYCSDVDSAYFFDYNKVESCDYYGKVKLFGWYVQNPQKIKNFEQVKQAVEIRSTLPWYSIPKLIDEYESGKIKAQADDNFLLKYNNSWKGKQIHLTAQIESVKKYDDLDWNLKPIKEWEVILKDKTSGYFMPVYFSREPSSYDGAYGLIPNEEDIMKFKKNDVISIVTSLWISEYGEEYFAKYNSILNCYDEWEYTKLRLGYSEILSINGEEIGVKQ